MSIQSLERKVETVDYIYYDYSKTLPCEVCVMLAMKS